MPKSLKDARKDKDLEGFIKEHEKDAPGDLDKLQGAIKRPASSRETASKARKASQKASSAD